MSRMESALLRQPMCKNEMQENSRKIIEHDKFADFCLCSFVICCNYQFAIVYFTCCSVCCECLLFFLFRVTVFDVVIALVAVVVVVVVFVFLSMVRLVVSILGPFAAICLLFVQHFRLCEC